MLRSILFTSTMVAASVLSGSYPLSPGTPYHFCFSVGLLIHGTFLMQYTLTAPKAEGAVGSVPPSHGRVDLGDGSFT